jgi:putative nucleotidyltransferase with HDIG domain
MFIPRTLAELEGQPGRGQLLRGVIVAASVALVLFAILSANITFGQENVEVGQVAGQDIRAPRQATLTSATLTEQERDEAAAAVQPVYTTLKSPAANQMDQLREYDAAVRRVGRILGRLASGDLEAEAASASLAQQVPELSALQRALVVELEPEAWEALAAEGRPALETHLGGQLREDQEQAARSDVRDSIDVSLPADERQLVGDLAAAFVRANQVVNEQRTEELRQAERNKVEPQTVTVLAGETIVSEGERVTALQREILDALGLTAPRMEAGTVAGNAILALLLGGLMVAYLWRFQPEVWHRNRSLLLFVLALVVSAIAIRVAGDRTLWAFVVPTSATVLLIGILLHSSAGVAMAAILAALTGIVNREALELAVYVFAGGVVALLTIERAERLNSFVRVGVLLAITNVVVVTAFGMLSQREPTAILQLAAAGAVNAGLAVILAVGSFAVLGNVFGIMTVFQLLELANPSSRLLRRLLLETPGTYHHSVMVGNLAERAAETIGADPLLARVAAYYHDIGKMKNPLAFIENQAGAHNIHDDLSAETSARIISGHIRDGIDLAYEHGLPVQIIGFIPQHHGTSVMSFFYTKALAEVGGNEELVNRSAYRYPGPKPQSKEAAILMLADGVEASVRSLDEKDEASIRGMVDSIIDARVEDGQFDDAELTLKNISQIKEAFVQQLLGMYHSRIKYPDNVVPIERREQA